MHIYVEREKYHQTGFHIDTHRYMEREFFRKIQEGISDVL